MPKLSKNEAGYQLQGSLLYDSITPLLDQATEMIKTSSERIELDCKQLSRIDSAGIALLIRWQRHCEQNNKKLHLTHLPQQAISLIKANKLNHFFHY